MRNVYLYLICYYKKVLIEIKKKSNEYGDIVIFNIYVNCLVYLEITEYGNINVNVFYIRI